MKQYPYNLTSQERATLASPYCLKNVIKGTLKSSWTEKEYQ